MKVETIGKMLIAAGVVILLYALSMPVTLRDSGIANIHLISERQNTLLFGGFLFLAGIVLFAVFKLKQTKEDVDTADKLLQERKDSVKSFMAGSDRGPLSIAIRLALGIALGAYSAILLTKLILFTVYWRTGYHFPKSAEMIVLGVAAIAVIAYAFRKISIKKVIVHFVVLAAFAAVSIPLRSMLIGVADRACSKFLISGYKGLEFSEFLDKSQFCLQLSLRYSAD